MILQGKIRFDVWLFGFAFILSCLSSADADGDPDSWAIERDIKVLNAVLPKTKALSKPTAISARDLDDQYAFPCLAPNSDAGGPGELREKYAVLPRLLLTDKFKNQIWMCAPSSGYRKISDDHFSGIEIFSIFLREPGKDLVVLENQGEIMVQPVDIEVGPSAITLLKNVTLKDGKPAYPFSQKKLECSVEGCKLTETCAVSARGINSADEIKRFDQQEKSQRLLAVARTDEGRYAFEIQDTAISNDAFFLLTEAR